MPASTPSEIMSQFFISCKESRIENNRSFYGCFYLGPFEPSQSITIANALRRTLLSEIYGLGIVSVQIEGASHEYSSLPGVRDSVLDILLNLKEIVLKKTIKNFKPQIGYLRVRGPGVVRASHLGLPPFIQCVDPNQYIATLADNGFLNMKFIIQYGNKWLSPNTSPSNLTQREQITNVEKDEGKNLYSGEAMSAFNTHVKKRRLILKKLKQMGISSSNSYIKMLSKSAKKIKATKENSENRRALKLVATITKKYPGINLRGSTTTKKLNKFIQKQINLPNSIKHDKKFDQTRWLRSSTLLKRKHKNLAKRDLLNLPNYLKQSIKNETLNINTQTTRNLSDALSSSTFTQGYAFKANPLNIDAIFNPIKKVNYIIEINDFKAAPQKMLYEIETSELYEMLKNSNLLSSTILEKELDNTRVESKNWNKMMATHFASNLKVSELSYPKGKVDIDHILEIKRELNSLKKETTKHNITLEIWTNGSIHPRDALYQGFKNLINIFVKLKKINTVSSASTLLLDSELQKQNLLKKIKMD